MAGNATAHCISGDGVPKDFFRDSKTKGLSTSSSPSHNSIISIISKPKDEVPGSAYLCLSFRQVTLSSLHRANDRPLKVWDVEVFQGWDQLQGRAVHMKMAGTERSHKSDLAET